MKPFSFCPQFNLNIIIFIFALVILCQFSLIGNASDINIIKDFNKFPAVQEDIKDRASSSVVEKKVIMCGTFPGWL